MEILYSLNLPIEIVMKILTNIPNLVYNKKYYKRISKSFYVIVKALIKDYNEKFDLLVKNYMNNNFHKLIKKLIENDDLDSVTFLLNNYDVLKYVNFYAGHYARIDLIQKLNNYQEIAKCTAYCGHFDIVKYAVDNGVDNFNGIAENTAS